MLAFFHTIAARIRRFLRPGDLESDFDQEMAAHLQMAEDDGRRRGLTVEEARRAARVQLGGLTQLRESGVVLLVGTDSGIPMKFHSQSTWRELDAWVNILGVDPMTAIRGATYWPSVAMKVDRDVGTLTPGKYADIVAVRGDVLRHIALLQRVDVVVKRGVRYR